MSEQIHIRPVIHQREYSQVEELQHRVWRLPDSAEVVPAHLLKAVAENGGLLLGAFADEERMVGFVFGFLARQDGRPKHHSHMMGVLPEARDRGLGFRLKCAQREAVLAQGLDWITWTYDPLEARNAHLNVNKLGVVCSTYQRDAYGELRDGLSEGIPSDRFQVDWWLRSARVMDRLTSRPPSHTLEQALADGAVIMSHTSQAAGARAPSWHAMEISPTTVLIEIPGDFQKLKRGDMQAAREWRFHTRQLFELGFRAGYVVTELISETNGDERRCFYVLTRREPDERPGRD